MADEPDIEHGSIGHNRPPSPIEITVEEMKLKLEPFTKRRDEFVRALGTVVVRDRTTASMTVDTIGMARDVQALIKKELEAVSEPLFTAHRAAISTARNFWEPVDRLVGDPKLPAGHPDNEGTAYGKFHAWEKLVADARVAQAREQAETEARLRAAAAPKAPDVETRDEAAHDGGGEGVRPAGGRAELKYDGSGAVDGGVVRPAGVTVGPVPTPATSPVRGDYGYTARKRKAYDVAIEDVSLVPAHILNSPKVREAIVAVAKDLAKHGMAIPGLRITEIGVTSVS